MGLVVQALQDPLLTLLAPTAPAADAAVPDAFQALLTELLGAQCAETIAGAASKDALPAESTLPEDRPAAGDPTKDEAKSAALLEALAQLQPGQPPAALAQLQPGQLPAALNAAAPDRGTGANSTTTVGTTQLNGEAQVLPAKQGDEGATAPPPNQAPASAGDAVPEPQTSSSQAPVPVPTASDDAVTTAAAKEHGDSSGKRVLPPGMFRAVLKGRAERVEHSNRGGKAPAADAPPETAVASAPPGVAPPVTQQVATSVVRSVGNANDEAATNSDGNGKDPGQPQPKASTEGVAHSSEHSILHRAEEPQQAPETAAPRPAPQTQLPEAAHQVVRAVLERVEQGGGEARLHLRPENLGEITIRVQTEGDRVRVEIRADRPEAAQVLREHSVDLSSMLGNQGLNLGNLSVGLGGPQTGGSQNEQQPQNSGGNRPGSSDFAALVGIEDTTATDRHNLLRAAYNPDGAHVYRV